MSDVSKGQTKGAAADEILVQPKLNNNFDANLEEGKVDIENNGVVFDVSKLYMFTILKIIQHA